MRLLRTHPTHRLGQGGNAINDVPSLDIQRRARVGAATAWGLVLPRISS